MIKFTSTKQVSLDDFIVPEGKRLNPQNRWIKLSKIIPWDELSVIYLNKMSKKMGRKCISARIVIGAVIVKHMKSISDEETIEEIRENPYLQYFLGLREYTYEQIFTPSLFVSIRRRLGEEEFKQLIDEIIKTTETVLSKQDKSSPSGGRRTGKRSHDSNEDNDQGGNQGHLIVDASVAPADIKYPTDLDLLNQSRLKSEQLIDILHKAGGNKLKPRTYRNKAKADYLALAKSRNKRKKTLRKGIGKQLRYLRRNIKTIDNMLSEHQGGQFPLTHKQQRIYWILQEIYRQQKEMYDNRSHTTGHRIVSLSQPHVRPIVRGKSGKEVEFGMKFSINLVKGCCNLHTMSWDAYNESKDLKAQIKSYKDRYGFYPADISADMIYGTRENRQYMKSLGINFSGLKLGRPGQLTDELKLIMKEQKAKRRQRVKVEGKFGEGKRKYDLNLVMSKRADTSISWVGSVFFVMNIAHLLRVIFLSYFKNAYIKLTLLKKRINYWLFNYKTEYQSVVMQTF